jgi:glutathione S-transferase
MAKKKGKKSAKRARKKLTATTRIKAAARKSAARAARGAPIGRKAAAKSARKKTPDKFVLHGFFGSLPSCKVGLMLSMCDVKWDYRHVNLPGGEQATPEFRALNRFGQVPVLRHGERTIVQADTILWYLARVTGRFAGGRREDDKLRISEWLNWDLSDMAVGVGISRFFTRMAPNTGQETKDFIRKRGERALGTLDRHLGSTKFLIGGAPTIADIAIFPWVATAEEGGFTIANYPNVFAWAERMMTIPGVAHPYTIMPKESRTS